MSNKILVALDGSEGGKRALDAAVEQAKLANADLVLAYVIEWSPYSFHTPQELEERHQRRESEIQRAHDSVLNPEVAAITKAGIKVESVTRHGKIAATLLDIVDEYGISQVYVGRRGDSLIHAMIFGSVTAALIQASPVPVNVVP